MGLQLGSYYSNLVEYYSKLFKTVSFMWTFFCFLLFLIGIIMFSVAIGYYYMIFSNADIEKPDNEMFNVI